MDEPKFKTSNVLLWHDAMHRKALTIDVFMIEDTPYATSILEKCHNYRLDRFYEPLMGEGDGKDEGIQDALWELWCRISDLDYLQKHDPEFMIEPVEDALRRLFPRLRDPESIVGTWANKYDVWRTDRPADPLSLLTRGPEIVRVFWAGIFL